MVGMTIENMLSGELAQLQEENAELKAKLKEYEDARVGSAMLMLQLGISTFSSKSVHAPWHERFEGIGDIYDSEAAARSAASRYTKGTQQQTAVITFSLNPVKITVKEGTKWPQKKRPRKKKK